MTGNEFKDWIEAMIASGRAKNKRECAELLGRSDQWISVALARGTDLAMALACNALLFGVGPFKTEGRARVARVK